MPLGLNGTHQGSELFALRGSSRIIHVNLCFVLISISSSTKLILLIRGRSPNRATHINQRMPKLKNLMKQNSLIKLDIAFIAMVGIDVVISII